MNRRQFLKSSLVGTAAIGINSFASNITKESRKQPNIVLIVSDDHGQNDLGCYGNQSIKTPNLDYLASEGVRFTNAYCSSASCTASRSTILTGIYNHANGLYGHMHGYHHFSAYEQVKSLPVLLRDYAGYKTARIGKYHLAPDSIFKFDIVLEGNSRNTVSMANVCHNFIQENKNNPFFLYFCTSDPHRSGKVEDQPFSPDRFGNRPEGYDGVTPINFTKDDVDVPPYLPDSPACREELAQYYQSVNRMDQGFGKLFDHLKNAGIWDNTIIIYISDNGIAFEGAKTNQYEPAIHLPCIIKTCDSKQKDTINEALINWVDLTPTILDYAGVLPLCEQEIMKRYQSNYIPWENTPSTAFQGRSFKSAIENAQWSDWNETYASHTFHEITMYYPMRTVITRQFKLIWNIAWQLPYPQASDLWGSSTWQKALSEPSQMYGKKKIKDIVQRPQFELYNLVTDPNEADNLAYQSDYKDKLEELKGKIRNFQLRTQDPWIIKWEHE